MKAKHFKKLRKKLQWYDVQISRGLFGDFPWNWDSSIRVLAKNDEQACYRAQKRGYGLGLEIDFDPREDYAKWRVKLSSKSDHWKNIEFH